jgi:hypothetical protein
MDQIYHCGLPVFNEAFLKQMSGASIQTPAIQPVAPVQYQPVAPVQQYQPVQPVAPVQSDPNKLRPGTKRCPHCSAIVGVRTRTCRCGYYFVPKAAQNVTPAYQPQQPQYQPVQYQPVQYQPVQPMAPAPVAVQPVVVQPVQPVQPTIDLNKWVSLKNVEFTPDWIKIGGIALSNADTGWEICSINPLQVKKGATITSKSPDCLFVERERFDAATLAVLSAP